VVGREKTPQIATRVIFSYAFAFSKENVASGVHPGGGGVNPTVAL